MISFIDVCKIYKYTSLSIFIKKYTKVLDLCQKQTFNPNSNVPKSFQNQRTCPYALSSWRDIYYWPRGSAKDWRLIDLGTWIGGHCTCIDSFGNEDKFDL